MPSRRQFLHAATVALGGSVATAGCLSVPASSDDSDETLTPASATPETTNRTTTGTSTDSAPTTAGDQPKWVRGEADPITVEKTVTDSKYEYVESNDTVRYPAVSSRDGVLEYGYESFDDWARGEGTRVGIHAVYDHVDERVGGGYGGGPDGSAVINLRVTTRVDSDGNVVSQSEVPFAELVAAAPRSVISTIHFAGHTATHTHEIWVRHVVRQND
jgi:hypothetical protein